MANINETAKNIMDKLNSISSAVDFFSNGKDTYSIYLSDVLRLNILNFITDFFINTNGKQWLVNQIPKFIVNTLPYIEGTAKVIFIGYLESMMSCSVKPIITEQMILDGVYFDLQSIDLFNLLKNEPVLGSTNQDKINKAGNYLYNIESDIKTIPDLVNSRDFNAFLWYTKNTPGNRYVWKREKDAKKLPVIRELGQYRKIYKVQQTIEYGGHYIDVTRICYKNGDTYYTLTKQEVGKEGNLKDGFHDLREEDALLYAKQGKENGIVTLEYNAKSSDLTDAEHSAMYVNEPLNNCLHVFIGCCGEISPEKENIHESLKTLHEKLSVINKFIEDLNSINRKLNDKIREYQEDTENEHYDEIKSCNDKINKINEFITKINTSSTTVIKDLSQNIFHQYGLTVTIPEITDSFTIPNEISETNQIMLELEVKSKQAQLTRTDIGTYPSAKSNYYYLHPLLEFNTDLVFSMKWFDEKVVTAQLINAITGCLDFHSGNLNANGLLSMNLSLQEQIIKSELDELIMRIIDDESNISVNDCFFTFDNDKFNQMLQESEMNRMGLFTQDGENPLTPPSPSQIMNAINALPQNATKEELTTAIEESLLYAIEYNNPKIGVTKNKLNFNVNGAFGLDFTKPNFNVFEIVIKKLVYVIVSTFLAPKIYMIIMFNLKLLESSGTSFNLMQYIEYCKSMFIDIINSIKEEVIKYFTDLMMDVINEWLAQFKPLMLKEQYMYYKQLIASCMECLKIHGNEYDWAQDMVNYADITDNSLSTKDEC